MSKTNHPQVIVGYGEKDGEQVPVVNGGFLLYMKDSRGITLDVGLMMFESYGWVFDVVGYFAACFLNPNYSLDRTLGMLKAATPVEHHERFERTLVYFLDNLDTYTEKYANQDWHKIPSSGQVKNKESYTYEEHPKLRGRSLFVYDGPKLRSYRWDDGPKWAVQHVHVDCPFAGYEKEQVSFGELFAQYEAKGADALERVVDIHNRQVGLADDEAEKIWYVDGVRVFSKATTDEENAFCHYLRGRDEADDGE